MLTMVMMRTLNGHKLVHLYVSFVFVAPFHPCVGDNDPNVNGMAVGCIRQELGGRPDAKNGAAVQRARRTVPSSSIQQREGREILVARHHRG